MAFGQAELEHLVASGDLELCEPDEAGAHILIAKARTHHSTAVSVAQVDPEIAMGALHAGNRKALDAVLLLRGLRATKTGGHVAPASAVRAILGGRVSVLRVYDVVRRQRHEGDYQSASIDLHPDDVVDNVDDSRSLVDACEAALELLPPFAPGR